MDHYAVIGNPVNHSKSPTIHKFFAKQTEEQLDYSTLHCELDEFEASVRSFFNEGGKGLNVTVPFKEEAWVLASVRSEDAELAGAVNTLFLDSDGVINGHNTDGIGLVRDIIQNHGGTLANKSILILGAGGASRGILLPFLREKPEQICIANRTIEKAEKLADDFARFGEVSACGFDGLEGKQFDWVINATSASLQGNLPPLPSTILKPNAWCYDLMYAKTETIFCQWARQKGAQQSIDGAGMLVEQAAESFYLWRGVRPATQAILTKIKS